MPALLGYLFAIAVFLGGGYAGVTWLASPDSPSTYHSPSDQKASHRKVTQQKNRSATKVAEGDGIPATGDGSNTSAAPPGAKRKGADVVAGDARIADGHDSVPSGGCAPIGLTSQGDMVFPLQCRELLEQRRGSVSSAVTAPTPKEPKENEAPALTKPTGSSDTQIGADMRKPSEPKAPISAPTDTEKYASRPTPTNGSEAISTNISEKADPGEKSASSKEPDERNNASTTEAFKPDLQTAKTAVGLHRPNTGTLAKRSRLEKMTLRTIEFPDGHREHRLLPIKHAQRVTLETEEQWYNPLGLR